MVNADELYPLAIGASEDLFPSVKSAIENPHVKKRTLEAFTDYVTLAQKNRCVVLNDYKDVPKQIIDCIVEHPKVIIERHFDESYASRLNELEELGELRLPFPKITVISGEHIDVSENHIGTQIFTEKKEKGLINLIYTCFLVQHVDHVALHVLFSKQPEIKHTYYVATVLLHVDENGKLQSSQPVPVDKPDLYDKLEGTLSSMVYHAIIAIHMLTISGGDMYISTPTPDEVATNKKRINKGKKPLIEFRMITVNGRKSELPSTPHGTHASPRLHWRRGHWRTMKKSGKKVWVDPMLVGDEKNGKIIKDYAVGKYEEQKHTHH